jgi:hypothetical protein
MLDPWIIEEIKKRERQKDEQPSVVIELPIQGPEDRRPAPGSEDPPRGVAIIDYGIACW